VKVGKKAEGLQDLKWWILFLFSIHSLFSTTEVSFYIVALCVNENRRIGRWGQC
jgi:hypothetical protein